MKYNDQIRARDLFMNERLAGIFPQFTPSDLNRKMSFAEKKDRITKYIVAAINGTLTGEGEITVNGNHAAVLGQIKGLQPLIEALYNNMPKLSKALRENSPLYLPFATKKQIEDIRSPEGKARAMQAVMDNFQYNPDIGALNSVKHESPEQFEKNRQKWAKKVGYRRLKRV